MLAVINNISFLSFHHRYKYTSKLKAIYRHATCIYLSNVIFKACGYK